MDSAFRTTGEYSVNLIKSRELNPENVAVSAQATSFLAAGGLVHLLHPIRD